MEIHGRVQNGVVVLEHGVVLPEGVPVTVRCDKLARSAPQRKKRVKLPLVPSKHPGTLPLTNEGIAEILEEEELSGFQSSLRRRNV